MITCRVTQRCTVSTPATLAAAARSAGGTAAQPCAGDFQSVLFFFNLIVPGVQCKKYFFFVGGRGAEKRLSASFLFSVPRIMHKVPGTIPVIHVLHVLALVAGVRVPRYIDVRGMSLSTRRRCRPRDGVRCSI